MVMYIRIFCYWVLLHYKSFKTIFGGFNGAFWWFGVLSEDRFFFFVCRIHQNYLVALIAMNSYLSPLNQLVPSLQGIIDNLWSKVCSPTLDFCTAWLLELATFPPEIGQSYPSKPIHHDSSRALWVKTKRVTYCKPFVKYMYAQRLKALVDFIFSHYYEEKKTFISQSIAKYELNSYNKIPKCWCECLNCLE